MPDLARRLADVRQAMSDACRTANRAPDAVTLVAISKAHGPDAVERALAAGQRVFGENRVQEAMGKFTQPRAAWPELELHLIGPLQTNKVRDAVALFDVIQSIDREKLARRLADECGKQDRLVRVYLQVNTGEEPQKTGVMPQAADAFVQYCRDDLGLSVEGLMCIPPVDEAPALHFALLRTIAERNGLAGLSMGMSGDYQVAIRLGATHVRVGTAIFGPRQAVA